MEVLDEHLVRQPRYPTLLGTGSFASRHYCWFALDERMLNNDSIVVVDNAYDFLMHGLS